MELSNINKRYNPLRVYGFCDEFHNYLIIILFSHCTALVRFCALEVNIVYSFLNELLTNQFSSSQSCQNSFVNFLPKSTF